MDDVFLIGFLYNFIVNEMLGSLLLFVVFIVIIIMGLFFMAGIPKDTIMIFGVALISIFTLYNYVIPVWIYVLVLSGIGFTWYRVIRSSA